MNNKGERYDVKGMMFKITMNIAMENESIEFSLSSEQDGTIDHILQMGHDIVNALPNIISDFLESKRSQDICEFGSSDNSFKKD